MNNHIKIALGLTVLTLVGGGGYWIGTHATVTTQVAGGSSVKAGRKVLYYRNPMGLPDASPGPKKDAMGMDYVAVYDGHDEVAGQLSISTDKVQKLGVKSEAATLRDLNRTLRVTGRIEVNERRTYTIAPKFAGWVEKLYVNTNGQTVGKGQPLFEVYSPELVSVQREHELAVQGLVSLKGADEEAQVGMRQLAAASRDRLRNWDITDQQMDSVQGQSRVTFRAPASGIVLEKKAVEGMRFMAGEVLYQIADLSTLWVITEVNEQDIAQVKVGSHARIQVDAYSGRDFAGKVDFVYPTLNAATRTVQVRMAIANPHALLKPAMYANAAIHVGGDGKVLTIPNSAVIDSGKQQVALVRLAEGRFEPRRVSLGQRSDGYVQVLSGVAEGEQVVTSANFLIDAESNFKAALNGMTVATSAETTAATSVAKQSNSAGHQAHGTLNAINDDGTVSITHEAIQSLGWTGMSMDFELANSALVAGIKPGSVIDFELVEREPGVWVITKLQAQRGVH
ncbi:MAG: efflux RND transporter periplasmic adaptor subunit [Gallionella sp.]